MFKKLASGILMLALLILGLPVEADVYAVSVARDFTVYNGNTYGTLNFQVYSNDYENESLSCHFYFWFSTWVQETGSTFPLSAANPSHAETSDLKSEATADLICDGIQIASEGIANLSYVEGSFTASVTLVKPDHPIRQTGGNAVASTPSPETPRSFSKPKKFDPSRRCDFGTFEVFWFEGGVTVYGPVDGGASDDNRNLAAAEAHHIATALQEIAAGTHINDKPVGFYTQWARVYVLTTNEIQVDVYDSREFPPEKSICFLNLDGTWKDNLFDQPG